MCLVVVVTINMLGAGAYGEAEFVFACVPTVHINLLISYSEILFVNIDLSRSSLSQVLSFLVSSLTWEVVRIMIALDSATGRTLDHSFSITAYQELKAGSLAGGLLCRPLLSRLLELRLLLYVTNLIYNDFIPHDCHLDCCRRSQESSS
jgi:hypothetical protein